MKKIFLMILIGTHILLAQAEEKKREIASDTLNIEILVEKISGDTIYLNEGEKIMLDKPLAEMVSSNALFLVNKNGDPLRVEDLEFPAIFKAKFLVEWKFKEERIKKVIQLMYIKKIKKEPASEK